MAEAPQIPDEAETRARWGAFAWSVENAAKAKEILGRYPAGRSQSASLPLLDLAQRQVGAETNTQGWLPVPVIEFVAREIGVPYMRVYEVATFYTMFNMAPVGRYHVQVCGTTPCMLAGSDDVFAACKNHGLIKGKTTPDGLFTLTEVECLGVCANAPMVQINDDNYEDLDFDRTAKVLEALARGETPPPGSTTAGARAAPEGGPTSLKDMVSENHDYRGMGMKDVNPIVAVLAVIGGLVVLGFLLRVAFGLLPLLALVAVGVVVYLFFQQQAGRR